MTGPYFYDFDGEPISAAEWSALFKDTARQIADTQIGDVRVSTVWLGYGYGLGDDGPPLIFETMVFGGKHDEHTERYATRDAALAGHDQVVAMVCDLRAGDPRHLRGG